MPGSPYQYRQFDSERKILCPLLSSRTSFMSYHVMSYHISYIVYYISYIIYHISYIVYRISYIINHVSYHFKSYHISYIIYHISYHTIYHIIGKVFRKSSTKNFWAMQGTNRFNIKQYSLCLQTNLCCQE